MGSGVNSNKTSKSRCIKMRTWQKNHRHHYRHDHHYHHYHHHYHHPCPQTSGAADPRLSPATDDDYDDNKETKAKRTNPAQALRMTNVNQREKRTTTQAVTSPGPVGMLPWQAHRITNTASLLANAVLSFAFFCYLVYDRLFGLVVKASTSRAEHTRFDSR